MLLFNYTNFILHRGNFKGFLSEIINRFSRSLLKNKTIHTFESNLKSNFTLKTKGHLCIENPMFVIN